MSDLIDRQESKDISEINKFIDGLEEIFADLRERHVDDSVCGLCEYDGAYIGQSGDWCNECPGFDKDDCFKLSDETRKKWIEEIVNAYPDHTADISKKVSISCGQENDAISRKAAIDRINKQREHLQPDIYPQDKIGDATYRICAEFIARLPSTQPETATVTIGRTKGGVVMWYECDACGESIDQKDCYCRNCGRKLTLPEPYRGGDSE